MSTHLLHDFPGRENACRAHIISTHHRHLRKSVAESSAPVGSFLATGVQHSSLSSSLDAEQREFHRQDSVNTRSERVDWNYR